MQFLTDAIFDPLILFDYDSGEFKPVLATAWRTIDDQTLELDLRQDVTWHDGTKFTAEDVAYTINYLIDPKVVLRNKFNFDWMASVEVLDPYKIRIKTKQPTPAAWGLLAQIYVLPRHAHGPLPLDQKIEFGRRPVGTGPYRAVEVDRNKGVLIAKRENYVHASSFRPEGKVGKIKFVTVPDAGARTAELLAGNIELTRDISATQAAHLERTGKFEVTLGNTWGVYYVMMDAAGRSGNKALTDERVRRAILMALKHDDLTRIIVGKWAKGLTPPEGICHPMQTGCKLTEPPPAHNLQAAKALLKEAGYENGFDTQITAFSYQNGALAEVVSGALQKIGIRASVNVVLYAAYKDLERDGKIQMHVTGWGGGGIPDVAITLESLFAEGNSAFHGNQRIYDLIKASSHEMDSEKRQALTGEVFEINRKINYITPMTRYPNIWVHPTDVKVSGFEKGEKGVVPWGISYHMLSWK